MIIKLGTYFTLDELTVSQTATRRGLDNTPPREAMGNLLALVHNVLDPLRIALGKPLVVTSGYRSEEINARVGGSPTSDHRFGRAADVHQPDMSVRALMRVVIAQKLPFDQMIDEFGRWMHISFREGRNRSNILQARRIEGRTWYSHIEVTSL
jgi:zinc D-Ala-D-Ala carboxypeptidase